MMDKPATRTDRRPARHARRSNLLVICTDELRRDALGCMGHAVVRTPNIDTLARRGSVFANAYTPSPICVPARAALATGDFVHRTGHWDSAAPYCGTPRSWMHDARDAGYAVASFGKLHFRASDDDNGFSTEVLPMHVTNGRGWTVGLLRTNPPPFDAACELAQDLGAGPSEYTNYDLAVTAAAERWVADPSRLGAPWAAFVSLVSPHYPLRAPAPFFSRYDVSAMEMPIAYAPQERPVHPELRAIGRYFDYDRHFDADKVRLAKAAYYGLVSFADDCIGRVLRALRRSGMQDDTVVIVTSDHGEMLGDHGFWTKSVMYQASVGVPLVLAGPGVPIGQHVRTPVSLLDVAATARACCSGAVAGAAAGMPGRSLLELAAEPYDGDRTVFSEYHDGGSTVGSYMVRWNRWKYVHYTGMQPQLFDLEADPQERVDLSTAGTVESVHALSEGFRRLHAICDPDKVNAMAFADQRSRIEAFGGAAACERMAFNHTAVPRYPGSPTDAEIS